MSASPGDTPIRPDAVREVQERLTRDFASVPVPVIEEVVRRWVRSLADARVTQYLPILIERASRDELSRLAANPAQGSAEIGG
ncbi:MAG: three-helix bundle dimerization domain-containing protein [Frankiaceae bacterium]